MAYGLIKKPKYQSTLFKNATVWTNESRGIVDNCDVAIAIAGQYGTLSEIAYAFQLKKSVIGYKTWDIDPVIQANTPEEVISKLNKELNHV